MLPRDKIPGIIALVAALAAMLLLASGVGSLEFQPAEPFSLQEAQDQFNLFGWLPGENLVMLILRLLSIFLWVAIPITIIYILLSKEGRRMFLRDLIVFSVLLGGLYLILQLRQQTETQKPMEMQLTPIATPIVATNAPQIAFSGNPPRWITLVTAILVSTGVVLLSVMAYRIWQKQHRPRQTLLEEIARHADVALEALNEGEDFNQIILRCYRNMSRSLAKQRGLQRSDWMTSQEFAAYLSQRGLPTLPLQNLTRLFENVRYGAISVGASEQQEAIASLNAILEACKETR